MNKKLLAATAAIALLAQSAFAINVTVTDDANTLANAIKGTGVTFTSVSYMPGVGSRAAGTFTGGAAAGIGIEEGILITSGWADNVQGTANTSDAITTQNYTPGYALLDALIPGYSTHDAAYLTIEFTTTGGDLFFNYVFGSEEYNEWVGSAYNDVFGFFLDGVNLAVIPGTTTPVAINTVNGLANSIYYNNNDPDDTAVPYAFEYDGFTDVFTAKASGLEAGPHTIVLAIADAGDWSLDSGVFIQAGSFGDVEPPTPGVPDGGATILLLGAALSGLGMLRRKV